MEEEYAFSFTDDEIHILFGLVREAKHNGKDILNRMDMYDPERNELLEMYQVVNSCYRKLKKIVSDIDNE